MPASRRARVWVSPERARWAREERRSPELDDGAVVVELGFAGLDWLVREVLKEAGDAAVLEPARRPRRRPGRGDRARSRGAGVNRRDADRAHEHGEVQALLEAQRTVICASHGPRGGRT